MINDVICEKRKTREKDVVGIKNLTKLAYFPPITLWLILQFHTGVCVKQPKVFEKVSLSESRFYEKWQTSAIIREISDFNLRTGGNGSKSGVS